MTEPSGGSDLAALKTTAVRDGDDWVINGSKTFITNGYSADLVVVAARTAPEKKARGHHACSPSRRRSPGFSRGRKLDKVGQDESDTAELFFENVRVTDAEIVGELDGGFIHMMQKLPQERLGCAVSNVAHAKQILEETIAVRQGAQGVRAVDRRSSSTTSSCWPSWSPRSRSPRPTSTSAWSRTTHGELGPVDAAKAKWWSSQVQNEVLDHCVQLHGGYGFMNEYRVARAWRDARVTKIWAGSNEIMKELIGRDLGL